MRSDRGDLARKRIVTSLEDIGTGSNHWDGTLPVTTIGNARQSMDTRKGSLTVPAAGDPSTYSLLWIGPGPLARP
jgi:hypothetical protein